MRIINVIVITAVVVMFAGCACGRKKTPVSNEADVVQLPNGYVVGWRATSPKEIEKE